MTFAFLEDLKIYLSQEFNKNKNSIIIIPEICPEHQEGDITVNCFRLASVLKANPETIAQKTQEFIQKHSDIESINKIKAFINITLKTNTIYRDTVSDISKIFNKSLLPKNERKKILVEYSAPNTNKPLHLGHLRNNTLGVALVSLLKRIGHQAYGVNLINDRGIHICKSMLAYKRYGEGITPESSNIKGDHLIGKFYIKFEEEQSRQINELKNNNPELKNKADEELVLQTEIGKAAYETLQKWEEGDPEIVKLWEKLNNWVLEGFKKTYEHMGVTFDKVYLESDTYQQGKQIVLDALEKGIFKKRADGAIYADLKKYNLNEKVLLRSDGTSVYITQDLGTTLKKYQDFEPDSQIWVVGDEQIYHFKTLFALLKELNFEWAKELYHLAYGMVNLPYGKMKSREGTVVDADDIIHEMAELAKQAIVKRNPNDAPTDLQKRSEIIGIGALKFMLLKFTPKRSISFDPEASIKFEGDTGPYIQYACARINSILKKAGKENYRFGVNSSNINWELLNTKWERKIGILASFYPYILKNSAKKMDSLELVNYLLNLAKAFNSFYRECPVLNPNNESLEDARLALSSAVRSILIDGLNTLTIDVPDEM